jgi:hypothetical protein
VTAAPKRVEFAVFAPGFDPNVGGVVVLHQLCHYLNELGHTCHMVPWFSSAEVSPLDNDSLLRDIFDQRQTLRKMAYTLNPDLNTPVYRKPWKGIPRRNDLVVVYPEVAFGNPLRARNVARWLLHNPGFHNKNIYFVPGEVQFRYNEAYRPIPMPWIEVAEQLLTVMRIPWEEYKAPPEGTPRSGTAFLLR